jgi:phosphoribosyl 1,2-cyclic phosphate phosphodiesterase
MEIVFLGTGPSEPIPRPGHRDAACRDARRGGKSRRTRSSALLTARGATVLIDAGPDVEEQLERTHPTAIDAVLLTHGHADAAGGLRQLDRWAGRHFGAAKIRVTAEPATVRRAARTCSACEHIAFSAVRPFGRVRVGPFAATALPVRHSMTPGFATYGYLFGGELAYASDVASLPPRTAARLRGVRTLVLDAAMYFGTRIASHLSTAQAIRLGGALKVRRLVLTQIGHTYPPHDRAAREIEKYLRTERERPREVVLAHDGLRLRI